MAPQASYVTKLKVQLKLAIARLRMVQQRDEQVSKTHRRAMAQLLEAGKTESATIRVENIIRSDITSELHELLELYCELLLARAGLLEGPVCDAGLEEAVKSIVYAAPKTEMKELAAVRLLLAEKYGKEFVVQAMENSDGKVNEMVVRKLSVEPPRKELVRGYLEEIAKAYGVNWPRGEGEMGVGGGHHGHGHGHGSGGLAEGIEEASAKGEEQLKRALLPTSSSAEPTSPLTVTPPRMTTDNLHPRVTLGSVELQARARAAASARRPEGSVPDMDDLEKRFAALKKR
ncbi:increased sodium tolerance protein 1 [Ophiocordyceps camponoti-floridani]|uniref:Increased sodium tolerance protein 1 n=1 Tax=Ophiocordyceps camponoti-floridani TaxID=2030778 RepID=A0A8H4Q610_9HYPO|nr:increased sodium tolerance protein 1 [Ophiocordyceps camponoti-floridani]